MAEKASENGHPGGVPTSLVSYYQSVSPPTGDNSPVEPDVLGCPKMTGWIMVSQSTGQTFPARCGRLGCWYCCRVNAKKRSLAIAYARPEREVTFTQVGNDWQQVRDRMKQVALKIRREVGNNEWVWQVEENPQQTGHHVHAWQRGSYIPQKFLSEVAVNQGMGKVVHVSKLRNVGAASRYGLKGLTYGLKGVLADNEGELYLGLNGRRLTHQSRGYFASPSGEKMAVRDAEKAALAAANPQEDIGPWILTRSA